MIDVSHLISDFEDCLGWPYRSPGGTGRDCSESGIDCSGMFVRAFALQGAKIAHGSNTIWREYLSDKGKISSEGDLIPGMAVFKWNANTPAKFSDGLGDYQHIGLVTSTHPLRIVHASTTGMIVRADSSLGRKEGRYLWQYWGRLKEVQYTASAADAKATTTVSDEIPVVKSLLRKGARGADVADLQQRLRSWGYDLMPDGIFGEMTRQAVMSFQRSHGLDADGLVGPLTWAVLGVG